METTNSVYTCLPIEPLHLIKVIKKNMDIINLIIIDLLNNNYGNILNGDNKSGTGNILKKYLDELYHYDPDDPDSIFKKGYCLFKIRSYQDSLTILNQAIDIKKTEPIYYNIRGLVRQSLNNPKGALNDFDEAIKLNPSFFSALRNRSVLKRNSGDLRGSIEDLKKSIELMPENPEVHYLMATVEIKRGNYQRAIQYLNKGIKLCPTDNRLFREKGYSYLKIKKQVHAIKDLNKAIEINQTDSKSFYYRGLAKKSQFNSASALIDFKRALELDPNDIIKKEIEKILKGFKIAK